MPVKIRLARHGRRKKAFYHIVVADSRAPRDGKYIEKLGIYNPLTVPATIELNRDAALKWLDKGAKPTETVRSILRFKGVLFKKHLQRGVNKGAFSQEVADEKFEQWLNEKEAKVAKRREEQVTLLEKKRIEINKGTKKKVVVEANDEQLAFAGAAVATKEAADTDIENQGIDPEKDKMITATEEKVEVEAQDVDVSNVEEVKEESTLEKVKEVAEKVEDKVEDVVDKVEEKVEDVVDKVEDVAEKVIDKSKGILGALKEKVEDVVDKVEDAVEDTVEKAADKLDND